MIEATPTTSLIETADKARPEVAPQKGVWSQHWLLLLFVGMSLTIIIVAIILGQLLVAS